MNAALNGGNVTIRTETSGTGGNGDIIFDALVTWYAGTTLRLNAVRNVVFTAAADIISTGDNAGLVVRADSCGTDVCTIGLQGNGPIVDFFSAGSTVKFYYNPTSDTSPQDFSLFTAAGSVTGYMLVNNVTNLQAINTNLSGDYALGRDIDASATAGWNNGEGFQPLGVDNNGNFLNSSNGFSGNFDGLGHTISSLTIERFARRINQVGLFGVSSGKIANVGLIKANVIGTGFVGSLVGDNTGEILKAFASGTITARRIAGGFVGNNCGIIDSSYANVVINHTSNIGQQGIGGLVGANSSLGTIRRSYASGAVRGNNRVGGLAGASVGLIEFSYATGAVQGFEIIGGLVGEVGVGTSPRVVRQSYATGAVTYSRNSGPRYVGGLIGYAGTENVSDSYWDSFTTGIVVGVDGSDGTTSLVNVNAVTSDPTQSGPANYAFNPAAWANFRVGSGADSSDIDITGGQALNWRRYTGNTYPLLKPLLIAATLSGTSLLASVTYDGTNRSGSADGSVNATLADGTAANAALTLGTATQACSVVCINAGTYTVARNVSGLYSTQRGYDLITSGSSSAALTINPRAVNVRYIATSNEMTYGNVVPSVSGTVSISNLVAGDSNSDVLNLPGNYFSTTATSTSNVGSYAITGAGITSKSSNYVVNAVQADENATALIIDPRNLSIVYTANISSSIYGNSITGLTGSASATGLVNGDNLIGTARWGTTARSTSNIGTYGILGSGLSGGTNYTLIRTDQAASNATALTITPRALMITYNARATSGIYGDPMGTSGGTVASNGLVNGDALIGTAAWTTSANATSNVGTYNIFGDGLSASTNYSLSSQQDLANATALTITPRAMILTYTAASSSSVYGNALTGLSGSGSAAGLVNSDSLTGTATWTTSASGTSNIGACGIIGRGLNAGTNYNQFVIQAASNTTALTITPRDLTILYTANPLFSKYVQAVSGLTGTTSSSGLVNGDSLSGTAAWTTTAGATSNVGRYNVLGSGLSASSNYTLTASQAASNATALIIDPRDLFLIYRPDTLSVTYGNAVTATGVASTGDLVNGDQLIGNVVWTTTATSTSNVEKYKVVGSGLSASSNYTVSVYNADEQGQAITITPRALMLTYNANLVSSIYGNAITGLGGSVSTTGLVNNDTLSGTAAWTSVANSTSNIGQYRVVGSGLSASTNYTLSASQAGSNATALTINPRHLMVTYTANPFSSIYGNVISGLTGTASSTGLVNGDTLTGASWTTTASATSNVGAYGIVGSGLSANTNYTITASQAASNATALTITPRALKVTYTANPFSSIYGNTISALSGTTSTSGLVNGDTLNAVTSGGAAFTTTATNASSVGSYAINGGGISSTSANYAILASQAAGNATALTITPRALMVTYKANPFSSIYGNAISGLTGTATSSGLVNGDTLTGAS